MKKYILPLLLALALTFTLAAPALAETDPGVAEYERLTAQHGDFRTWPLSVKADYDAFLVSLWGATDGTDFVSGVPGADDLTQEQARDLALTALVADAGFPEASLDRFLVWYMFNVADPENPAYSVCFDPIDFEADYETLGQFEAIVHARTGEILLTHGPGDEAQG